eukprot:CAMPEP_0196807340 /NCGR_PEP_ID=MMETSP1362-20130617/7320_1 /TAXON_ID=163516 /ORGANISM="Leptocylindrus danicus, Strain CCMP1856" /LENGTH=599 /DNA_ID=CAMNT_0042181229 /DNA_START=72 /DNA_END=1871 /DNA_ORIENTATION=+
MATAFSPDETRYAALDSNSRRIRLFDTSTSQLKNTLVEPANTATTKANGADGASSLPTDFENVILSYVDHFIVSICRTSGKVTIWDVNRGVVAHTVDIPSHRNGMSNGSAAHHQSKKVFDAAAGRGLYAGSCFILANGDDSNKGIIYQYNVAKGKLERKIKSGAETSDGGKVAISPDGTLIVVASPNSGIRLISSETGKKIRKLKKAGNASNGMQLQLLEFSLDSKFILWAVEGGDAVYISPSEKDEAANGHAKDLIKILAVDSTPTHAQMIVGENSKGTAVVSCKSGSVLLFDISSLSPIQAEGTLTLNACCSVSCATKGEKVEALRASFHSNSPESMIMIMQKLALAPVFETVLYRESGSDGAIKKKIEIGKENAKSHDSITTNGQSNKRSAEVLGPGEAGTDAAIVDAEHLPNNKKARLKVDEDSDKLTEFEEADDGGPSIADRINALNDASSDDDDDNKKIMALVTKTEYKAPSTKSLAVILRQGLVAMDNEKLEIAFQCHDKRVIETTVEELVGNEVIDLLGKLVHRIAYKPARAEHLSFWIRTIVMKHSGLLMNDQDLAERLAPLKNLLNDRIETLSHFLKLEGRLNMLSNLK